MDLNIRPLANKDLFTVVDMLLKIKGEIGRQLTELKTAPASATATPEEIEKAEEERGKKVIMLVFDVLYNQVRQDLVNWFADLCGVTPEQFWNELPPESTIAVIEYLIDAQEMTSFFTRALGLFKKMSTLGSRFSVSSK